MTSLRMKHVAIETFSFLPAFGIILTITPDQVMNDLYNGVAVLLLVFCKGLLATLASMAGRYLTMKIQARMERKEPPIKKVNEDAANEMRRKFFKRKTKAN